jgi:hypothetical protein
MTTPYRIGVTGHRTLGDQTAVQFVRQTFRDLLLQAQREHAEGGVIALSGVTIFFRVNPTLRYGMASQAALSTHFQGRTAAKSPASMHLLHFKL